MSREVQLGILNSLQCLLLFFILMRKCPVLIGCSYCSITTAASVAVATIQDWLETLQMGDFQVGSARLEGIFHIKTIHANSDVNKQQMTDDKILCFFFVFFFKSN